MAQRARSWSVYLCRASDGSIYCGVSTDPVRRCRQHNGELKGGAKCLYGKRPVVLVLVEPMANRSAALRREEQIKRLSRAEKLRLLLPGRLFQVTEEEQQMDKKQMTVDDVKKELAKRLRKAAFEMEEAQRECKPHEHGQAFLWYKSRFEALQEMMWFIDPNYDG